MSPSASEGPCQAELGGPRLARRTIRLAGEPLRTGQVTATALGCRIFEALATMGSRQVFVQEIHDDAPGLSFRAWFHVVNSCSQATVKPLPRSCVDDREGACGG